MEKNRRGKSKVEIVEVKEPAPSVNIPHPPNFSESVSAVVQYINIYTQPYAFAYRKKVANSPVAYEFLASSLK